MNPDLPDHLRTDRRVVMTLDAGGTNLRFFAMRGGAPIVEPVTMSSSANNLSDFLVRLVEGFERIKQSCSEPPCAISFGFPGPADHPHGIIGDLNNLPFFRGGVALGPMLQNTFGVPVFINNDADLFTYGEAIGGLLPQINGQLAAAGSPKRFHNLFGVTVGTGLGGGIVRNGELFLGDNSAAGEIWSLPTKHSPNLIAEECASIRAVKRTYAQCAGIPVETSPAPDEIYRIATSQAPGNQSAAVEAYRRLGEVLGEVLCASLSLIDGLAVIGGGLSGAAHLFFPALMAELNGEFITLSGKPMRRLIPLVFNLEDADQLQTFLKGDPCEIRIPQVCTGDETASHPQTVTYDRLQRTGVGLSRLGTSQAAALGAYAFAIKQMRTPD